MKAYAPDLDKKPEDIEKTVWTRRDDPSLWRRAGRIFRIKIYFTFHGRDDGHDRKDPANPFSTEGKIIISFVVSLFMLSILVTSRSFIRQLCAIYPGTPGNMPGFSIIQLFAGITGFMVTMIPVIFFVMAVCLAFSILNHLADRYDE